MITLTRMVCQRGNPLGQAKNKHIFKKETDFNEKSPCRNENSGCNEGRYERKGKDMRKRFSKALTLVLALTMACTSFSFASAATATKKVVVGTPEITYVGTGFYGPVFRRSTRKLPTFTFFSSADVAYYMPCYP